MKLQKYLQSIGHSGIKSILSALPKILHNYNHSVHSTTKFAPNDVNEKNAEQVQSNIIARSTVQVRHAINVGDKVRVRKKDKSFEKGHTPQWSREIFNVIGYEGVYYIVDGNNSYNELRKDRKYLRAHIQKVSGDIQINPSKQKIKQNLQQMTNNQQFEKISEQTEQAIEQRTQSIKRRERKKTQKQIELDEQKQRMIDRRRRTGKSGALI